MEQTKIEIGTRATGRYASDCYPYEVVGMTQSGKTISIRRLDSTPTENYDYYSNQEHTFSSNENNPILKVRKGKLGWKTPDGLKVSFGGAREYRDPHF